MSKSGWLWKEGESGLRWKRRFFELGGTNLMYYEDDTKATKRGTTSLVTAKIRNTKGARPGKFAFRIDLGADHKPHKLVLAADTLMETEEWVAALEALGIESSFNPMPLAQQTNAPAALGETSWRTARRSTDNVSARRSSATVATPSFAAEPAAATPPTAEADAKPAAPPPRPPPDAPPAAEPRAALLPDSVPRSDGTERKPSATPPSAGALANQVLANLGEAVESVAASARSLFAPPPQTGPIVGAAARVKSAVGTPRGPPVGSAAWRSARNTAVMRNPSTGAEVLVPVKYHPLTGVAGVPGEEWRKPLRLAPPTKRRWGCILAIFLVFATAAAAALCAYLAPGEWAKVTRGAAGLPGELGERAAAAGEAAGDWEQQGEAAAAHTFDSFYEWAHWWLLEEGDGGATCADGLLISGTTKTGAHALMWLSLLLWTFVGVAIVADIFMVAIEVITSKETTQMVELPSGVTKPFTVTVWNATVANLTLMALGSSAPEILLSCIEISTSGFFAGELGPSTIVGSAAFNLLGITAVCVVALPPGEGRLIKERGVFGVTATFSVLAYVWLIFILVWSTPNVITPVEGAATFLLFPLLIALAFCADKGWCSRKGVDAATTLVGLSKDGAPITKAKLAEMLHSLYPQRLAGAHLKMVDADEAAADLAASLQPPKSRAYYRVAATRHGTGGAAPPLTAPLAPRPVPAADEEGGGGGAALPSIEFEAPAVAFVESAEWAVLWVRRTGPTDKPCSVHYATTEGTATAGEDFVATSGVLQFAKGKARECVRVKLIDDDVPEDDEVFTVALSSPSLGYTLGAHATCEVTIQDDDHPGALSFVDDRPSVNESSKKLVLRVTRTGGSGGTVGCDWHTRDGSAVAPADYKAARGTLSFAPGVTSQLITVEIVDDDEYERDETFQVVLTRPSGGATFGADVDGGPDRAIATVTIISDEERRKLVDDVAAALDLNVDNISLAVVSWGQQFREAVEYQPGGGAVGGVGYLIALPWKIVCALIPPPRLGGGWLCFIFALAIIGVLTAIIGDLANHMGCSFGILPSVTAITFVALGTSLPDTFASRIAAVNEPFADSSIGNIVGSNSVNVFLGLGLPWAAAAVYWTYIGAYDDTAAAAWRDKYSGEPWYTDDMPIGFVVPAADLGFSVAVFTFCALVCLLILVLRRAAVGYELGGPRLLSYLTAFVLVALWGLYVGLSAAAAYGVDLQAMLPESVRAQLQV